MKSALRTEEFLRLAEHSLRRRYLPVLAVPRFDAYDAMRWLNLQRIR